MTSAAATPEPDRDAGNISEQDDVLLNVAEVCRQAGVTRKALRVYEERGLVRPVRRTEAGYRIYGSDAVRRTRLVTRAKILGFTLAEAAHFLDLAERCGGDNHHDLAHLVERKIEETECRLEQLATLRTALGEVHDRLLLSGTDPGRETELCTCSTPPGTESR